MQDFIERWKNEPKFKTKIELGLYTLFVVIVSIFAISSRGEIYSNISQSDNKNNEEKNIIEIPQEYNYTIKITINNKEYTYSGSKNKTNETITKIVEDNTYNYIYQEGRYYKDTVFISNIVSKEEVYDIIEHNYINLDTINKYLSLSQRKEEISKVYLKDIVIGNETEEYITITLNENKINIDYTSLMKLFDKTIESSNVEVVIKEIE